MEHPATGAGRVLDADIRWMPVDDDLPGAVALPVGEGARLLALDDDVLFEDGFVRFRVRGTDEIRIQPMGDHARESVSHHAYGMAARILLLHAGRFSLHASVIDTPRGALAVGGDSGAGKSTTSVALMQQPGCRLVIDDVTPLAVHGRRVVVEPYARPVHLYPDDAHALGLAPLPDGWIAGAGEIRKLALHVADATDVDLRLLAVLRAADDLPAGADDLSIREVTGAERFRAVVRLSNATGMASLGRRRDPYFAWVAAVADRLPMREMARRSGADTRASLIAELLRALD